MARLFITFLNMVFVLIATTTALAEHNPKPKPRPNQKPHTFVLPLIKEINGNYYTNVTVGEPPLEISLDIAISGEAIWFPCIENGYKSTTYKHTLCRSRQCKQAKGECSTCSGSYGPTCRNNTCVSHLYYGTSSFLLEDNVTLSYMSTSAYVAAPKLTARVPLACMTVYAGVDYIPYTGSRGIIGLSNGSMSLVNRLVSSYKIPFKVALCLPSKPGINDSGLAYIGGGPYMQLPNGKDVSELLVSTPLIRQIRVDVEDSYYIDVKSMEVNGKTLSFNPDLLTFNASSESGGTMIAEGVRYTYLQSSIYKPLLKAFARNAKKEKAVEPFTDCFSSKSFGGKKTPVVTLVLGGGAKWNIYGPNSLVKLSKSVVCLVFIDRGLDYSGRNTILIGGYLMEDNLVEFVLEASRFSITSSLLLHNTSCSSRF